MLTARPTEHLAGVTVKGDFCDFEVLVNGICNMAGPEDRENPYYGAALMLLTVCGDLRQAGMGQCGAELEYNGMDVDIMRFHSMVAPENNVYYSVNVLFPRALFVAEAMDDLCAYGRRFYRKKGDKTPGEAPSYGDYLRDCGALRNFRNGIFAAYAEAVGDDVAERLVNSLHNFDFTDYIIQYVEKCDASLLKTAPEKRPAKLRTIASSLTGSAAYEATAREITSAARLYNCTVYDIRDERIRYPEVIEW